MPAFLLSLTIGPPIPIDQPILLVGRVKGADIRLRSPRVSRRHCCLAVTRDGLLVRDLGSRAGVIVNGQRVRETTLRNGDQLQIGPYHYEVCGNAAV